MSFTIYNLKRFFQYYANNFYIAQIIKIWRFYINCILIEIKIDAA